MIGQLIDHLSTRHFYSWSWCYHRVDGTDDEHRPDPMCCWLWSTKATKISWRAVCVLCRIPPYGRPSPDSLHSCMNVPNFTIYCDIYAGDLSAAANSRRNDITVTPTGARWRRQQPQQSLTNQLCPRPTRLPQHPLPFPRPSQ